ncbi:MAG: phosphatidate cytidylyltransferase [Treponema sp.]|nr:phosphatidate cytidylyltransferase [Treponema sp.]MBQ7881770.1 phosphatidate cytidylyltransferase [Treponema sp.]
MLKIICPRIGIDIKKHFFSLKKEVFRKSIHMCTAFIPVLLHFYKVPILCLLSLTLLFYLISEILRWKGVDVPIVSNITNAAARKRDANKIVLGPITLVLGIIITSIFWNEKSATVGIFALAFGDGLASLAGKTFGRIEIPFTGGKTVAGSLTCFNAIFCTSWFVLQNTTVSFILALVGTIIEVLPLRDLDNIFLPTLLGGLTELLLPHIQFM